LIIPLHSYSSWYNRLRTLYDTVRWDLSRYLTEPVHHADVQFGDRLFYFTTCGWMMWNWLASGLASGATLILYDGAPGFPDMGRMWRLIDDQRITHFGTSPKFLGAVNKPVTHQKQIIR
jgi:acetoacetyl-CoA synthetase